MKKSSVISWLRHQRTAVLKGGPSKERSISLKTGQAVESSFRRLKIPFTSIDVGPGFARKLRKSKTRFCFIALHGTFGEDGRIQGALDTMGISYTGSGVMASAVAMDKDYSKRLFLTSHIPTPAWISVGKDKYRLQAQEVTHRVQSFLKKGPLFIKPTNQGSAIGATPVYRPSQISAALRSSFRVGEQALIERLIKGRELTVGVLGGMALPVIEIRPVHRFYDFHSKYAKGGSKHLLPAPLSREKSVQVQKISLRAFQALGCKAYGRVDLMMDDQGKIYVLEVNTIPGMTSTSLLPEAAQSVGIDFDELILRIVAHSVGKPAFFSSGE